MPSLAPYTTWLICCDLPLEPEHLGGDWLIFSLLLRSPELALSQQARFPGDPKTDFEGTGMSKYIYLLGFGGFAQKISIELQIVCSIYFRTQEVTNRGLLDLAHLPVRLQQVLVSLAIVLNLCSMAFIRCLLSGSSRALLKEAKTSEKLFLEIQHLTF